MIWSEKGHFGPCLAYLSYQCLGVPKLCDKFGCSRIPRTANNSQLFQSFTVNVKEASPFVLIFVQYMTKCPCEGKN